MHLSTNSITRWLCAPDAPNTCWTEGSLLPSFSPKIPRFGGDSSPDNAGLSPPMPAAPRLGTITRPAEPASPPPVTDLPPVLKKDAVPGPVFSDTEVERIGLGGPGSSGGDTGFSDSLGGDGGGGGADGGVGGGGAAAFAADFGGIVDVGIVGVVGFLGTLRRALGVDGATAA